jgi:hypothetical protein
MIGMKVSEHHIGNIARFKASLEKPFQKPFPIVDIGVPEKFIILLVAPSRIDQNVAAFSLNYQRPESENNKVVFIGPINPRPERFGNHPEHCAAINPEVCYIEDVHVHTAMIRNSGYPKLKCLFFKSSPVRIILLNECRESCIKSKQYFIVISVF